MLLTSTANYNYEALKQFYNKFPDFKGRATFISGESYAGVYLPMLANLIIKGQTNYQINFKGVLIGNGYFSQRLNINTMLTYAYAHGLLDEGLWHSFSKNCCKGCIDTCDIFGYVGTNTTCLKFAVKVYHAFTLCISNPYDIYRNCDSSDLKRSKALTKNKLLGMFSQTPFLIKTLEKFLIDENSFEQESYDQPIVECIKEDSLTNYMNLPKVREVLNIPKNLNNITWQSCNDDLNYDGQYADMVMFMKNILKAKVPVLSYYGDTDIVCNFLLGERFATQLGIKLLTPKSPWIFENQIGGTVTEYEGFTLLTGLEIMQNTQAKKGSSLAINELTCNEPTVIQTELGQMLKIESFVRRIRHSSTMIPMEYFDDYNCLEDLLNSGHNILTKSEAFSLKLPKRWDRDSHLNIIMEYGLWSDKDKLQSEGLNQFFKDLFVSISFVKTLPLFNILTIEEQSILITKTMLQLYLMLQLYYSFEINATTLSLPSGEMPYEIMKTTSIKCNCELLERYARKKYIMPMKKFSLVRPDISEFVLLMVLLVANPAVSDELSPKAKEIIRTEQERYGKILLQLEQNRHGQGPGALRYSQCLELMAQIKETDEPLKEDSNTISKPEESQKEHNKCRSEHPPSNQGLGHGCELIITILCDLHCTSETQKSKGYTSGLCKPFDPVCYCKC
uniref:Carboxypeptidase n=1 Tax=Meloidogyne floridensis TaxID=298350 RepID=A0A915NVD2_9BILA